jgi:hypothetical protein
MKSRATILLARDFIRTTLFLTSALAACQPAAPTPLAKRGRF